MPCQNCDTNPVLNYDFEIFDSNCISGSNFNPYYGWEFFSSNCVENWGAAIATPDLFTPNIDLINLNPLLTSNMAGMCYSQSLIHEEAIISDEFTTPIINEPYLYYSLSFDVAAACLDGYFFDSQIIDEIDPGILEIGLESNGLIEVVETFELSDIHNVNRGISNICYDKLSLSQDSYSKLQISVKNGGEVNGNVCYGLLDNLSLNCNLESSNFALDSKDLGNNMFEFSITDLSQFNLLSTISNFRWDFGDGTIVNGGHVIQHTFSGSDQSFMVCCYLENQDGCCANICTIIEIGKVCHQTICLDCVSVGDPEVVDVLIVDNTGMIQNLTNDDGNHFSFPYCFNATCPSASGSFGWIDLVNHINSYLSDPAHSRTGNAFIQATPDPLDCRHAIIYIENSNVTFTSLFWRNSSGSFSCPFQNDCP